MTLGRILFALGIVSAMSLALHRYLWARLVRDAAWPAPWAHGVSWALAVFAALVPLSFLMIRGAPRAVHVPLAWVAYSWLGIAFYLFVFAVVGDAAKGIAAIAGALPADPERRRALARILSAGSAAMAGALGVVGGLTVARGFVLRRVRVALGKLPERASGYRIVQLTDLHVGPTLGRDFVEAVVREANRHKPDLIVITGDLVDGSVGELRHQVAPLAGLHARDGVFFVTGNHEYYSGADEWIAHLRELGIVVLRNERVAIRDLFDLAGVDDASASRMLAGHGQDVGRALAGRDPGRAVVLLAHQPKALKEAVAHGVDLQLSGHVHAGQLVPFNWLARLDQPFVSGLHRVADTWLYVSAGTGYWGPPMRVGTRSEVTLVELCAGPRGA